SASVTLARHRWQRGFKAIDSGWFLSDNRQPLRDDDLELGVAVEEGGAGTAWRSEHFDLWEALEDFLPQHLDLQFGHSCTDAAVNAGPEGQVTARVGSVDDEVVRPLEHVFVTVARKIPHHDLIAACDAAAPDGHIPHRRPSHVSDWRLPTHEFGREIADHVQPGTQLRQLRRISIEGDDACADRAARRVVPPYYEQHDIAVQFLPRHASGARAAAEQTEQILVPGFRQTFLPEGVEGREALAHDPELVFEGREFGS